MKRRSEKSSSRSEVRPSVLGSDREFERKLRAAAGRGPKGIDRFERDFGLRARKAALRECHPRFRTPVADLYGNERTDSLFTPASMTTGLFASTDWAVSPPPPISDVLTPAQLQTLLQQQDQILARRRTAIAVGVARSLGEALFLLPCARDAMQFLVYWVARPVSSDQPQEERQQFHKALSCHLIALGHPPRGLSPGSLSSKIMLGQKSGLDRTTTMRGGSFQLEMYALQLLLPWDKLAFALILDQRERTERAHSIVKHSGRYMAALAEFRAFADDKRTRVMTTYRAVGHEMKRTAVNKNIDPESRRLVHWRREAIPHIVFGADGLFAKHYGWGFHPENPPDASAMTELGDELLQRSDDWYDDAATTSDPLVDYGRYTLAMEDSQRRQLG